MFIHMNISDIHGITHPNPKVFYETELQFIIDYLNHNHVDLLTIAGDTFHKLYSGDSDELKYMVLFFKDLSGVCRDKHVKLRIIRGTLSHEKDQLNLLKFSHNICDVRFYEDGIDCEELDNGLTIRYIPEPYGDHYEFENKLKEMECDITIFHGTLMGKEYHIDKHYKPSERGSVLIDPNLLESYTRLYSIGGHFHVRSKYYTGSYSSNSFEDANCRKGFDIFTYENGRVSNKFVENKFARKFIIKNYTYEVSTLFIDDIKRDLQLLCNRLGVYDRLRLDIDLTNLDEVTINNIHLLINQFKDITFNLKRNIIDRNNDIKKENVENIISKDMKEIIFNKYKEKGGLYTPDEINSLLTSEL